MRLLLGGFVGGCDEAFGRLVEGFEAAFPKILESFWKAFGGLSGHFCNDFRRRLGGCDECFDDTSRRLVAGWEEALGWLLGGGLSA